MKTFITMTIEQAYSTRVFKGSIAEALRLLTEMNEAEISSSECDLRLKVAALEGKLAKLRNGGAV